jgi:hypothetical protein
MDPLDDDLAKLVLHERAAEAPREPLARISSRLGLVAPLALVHGSSGATGHASAGAAHSWLATHALAVAVASFVGGTATGAVLYATVREPPPARIVYRERPAPPAPSVSPPRAAPPLEAAAPPPAPASRASSSARATSSPAPADSLAEERDVLDHARSLLGAGDAATALAILEGHGARFSKSQLGEEREALAIQSLVALPRDDEARARARRFHDASPNSLFAPVIEGAVRSIP